MKPPRKHKSSGVPLKEELELEDGNVKDLLVKRRRTEVSGSIDQLQQQIEVFGMENKAPDNLPFEDSTGKDPINVLTSCAVQNSGQANGRSNPINVLTSCAVQNSGQANGRSNESANSRLLKICKASGWKEPSYEFEEQGPPHIRIFKCKVTVQLDEPLNTIVECFSNPKPKKKAAQENAAQGALWCLQCSGYV